MACPGDPKTVLRGCSIGIAYVIRIELRPADCEFLARDGSNQPFKVAKPLALDAVRQKLVKLLAGERQLRWRFSFLLRRALVFLPHKSRRPPELHNPLLLRFGLHQLAITRRKWPRAGRVIGRLASFE